MCCIVETFNVTIEQSSFMMGSKGNQITNFVLIVLLPCILISTILFLPTNVLFKYLHGTLINEQQVYDVNPVYTVADASRTALHTP